MKERVCNYHEIFIKADGYVYPCCRLWFREEYRIGHVADPDIIEKILSFYKPCRCELFIARPPTAEDVPDFKRFNIETSMFCQAKCAMCCTGSPDYRGRQDSPYLDHWLSLIDRLKPASLTLQGGKVLMQRKTIQSLAHIKEKYPKIKLHCVSNMSVELSRLDEIEQIFDGFDVSMVGFQPETYNAIMGLDVMRTKAAVEELIRRGKVDIMIKYLLLPLNVHETAAWLQWALDSGARSLQIAYASGWEWIRKDDPYNFWEKIFDRSSAKLKKKLIDNFKLETGSCSLFFEENAARLLSVDREFAEENGLCRVSCLGGLLPPRSLCGKKVDIVKINKTLHSSFIDFWQLLNSTSSAVYIYGNGQIGKLIMGFLKDNNLKMPAGIIDDSVQHHSQHNMTVAPYEHFTFSKNDLIVLGTDAYQDKMRESLKAKGFPGRNVDIIRFLESIKT